LTCEKRLQLDRLMSLLTQRGAEEFQQFVAETETPSTPPTRAELVRMLETFVCCWRIVQQQKRLREERSAVRLRSGR
jgi:hypothetical protein